MPPDQWAEWAEWQNNRRAAWWSQHRRQNGDGWSQHGWHALGDRRKHVWFVADWTYGDEDAISTTAVIGTPGTLATEPRYLGDAVVYDNAIWQFWRTVASGSAAAAYEWHDQSSPDTDAVAAHQAATVGTFRDGLPPANALRPPAVGDWLTFKYPSCRAKGGFSHKFYTDFPRGHQVRACVVNVSLYSCFQVLEVRSGWKKGWARHAGWSQCWYIAVRFKPRFNAPDLWTNFSQDRHAWLN